MGKEEKEGEAKEIIEGYIEGRRKDMVEKKRKV